MNFTKWSWKQWLLVGTGCVGIIILLMSMFFSEYTLYKTFGESMSPAVKDGEFVVVKKGAYFPERGDLIVFHYDKENLDYIKRVIGLPNDVVEIRNNQVYINGKKLKEPYLSGKQSVEDFGPYRVPHHHIFVLGDDRETSYDSREIGAVPMSSIKGKLVDY